MDPGSGQVILTASLDFESEVFYSFEVVATDGGMPQFENQTLVEVNVLDANDHSPQFSQVVYLATVAEGNYTGAPEPLVVVSVCTALGPAVLNREVSTLQRFIEHE